VAEGPLSGTDHSDSQKTRGDAFIANCDLEPVSCTTQSITKSINGVKTRFSLIVRSESVLGCLHQVIGTAKHALAY
jgi:hypothetical protein